MKRLPSRQCARQAVPGGGSDDGVEKADHPSRDAAHVQDVCRAAAVGDLVTRSISGHATEAMQRHYSTVALEEQRRGLANVLHLIRPSQPLDLEGAGQGAGSPREGAGSAFVKPGEERKPSI